LLGVSDIGRDDFVERKAMVGLLELISEDLSLDGELATHSILYLLKGGVKSVYGEGAH